jgi:phosphonate transport system ATP-binding protein
MDGLRKVWPDGTLTLDNLSLSVPGGEVVAILGRSGSGKSTLLRCACRLVEPTGGRVFVGGTEVTGLRGRALARARGRVGFVFQQFNLVRSYSALDNVLVARMAHVPWLRGTLGLWGPEDRRVAARCLEEVGLGDKIHAQARELSGGQQQRVAIARAFAQEPRALFADEPTASLDPHLAETVMTLLRDYGRAHRVPVLVNVHTVEHARRFADRVLGLQHGKIVHDGPAQALDDRALETIYGPREAR